MRAIWKGAVSFGLVSVPVKLYSATESHDISFRQVHAKDFETEDGQMVILDDQDFAELPTTSSREISVEKFVPSEQIDPLMLEKSYYLEPEKSGLKPYALLRDALRESDRVAVVTVALRSRTTPAVLRVRDDVLVLQTMMWPDEVRAPAFGSLRDVEEPKPQELKMAQLLLDTLAGDYDPSEFEDDYAEAVHELVEAKLEGGEVKRTKEAAPSAGEVVDLLAALQKSVAAAKTARGEDDTDAGDTSADDTAADDTAADDTAADDTAPEAPATKASSKSTAKKSGDKKSAAKKSSE